MNQKGFTNIFPIIIIVAILIIGGGFYIYKNSNKINPPSGEKNLPDLVVDSISYKAAPSSQDSLGMPVIGPGKALEFTLKIKNIGDGPVADSFYISNTRSNFDVTAGYYSHTQVVNYNKQKINPGKTIEVKILDSIDENTGKVRFLIATDGKTGQKDVPLPIVAEKNYQNNTLELQISN